MANKGDKEIEIQVQIENINGLNKFLKEKANFVNKEHQIDKYFSPKDKKFLKVRPVVEWLRLRDSSGKQSINYIKIGIVIKTGEVITVMNMKLQ